MHEHIWLEVRQQINPSNQYSYNARIIAETMNWSFIWLSNGVFLGNYPAQSLTNKIWRNLLAKKKSDFGGTFVRYTLTDGDKKAINDLDIDYETFTDWQFKAIQDGYKFSLSYSEENDCFIASISCRDKADSNYNQSYSSFHSNPFKALNILFYFHEILTGGDWNTLEQSTVDW